VAAGASSALLNISSIDYVLKRYVKQISYDANVPDRLDFRISDCVRELSGSIDNAVRGFGDRNDQPVGEFMSEVTFVRLGFAFSAMLTLSNRGYLYETAAVARMALEQIAWAFVAKSHHSYEVVRNLSATHSIGRLKVVYPTAGRYYHWLSEHSHWAYNAHVKTLSSSEGLIEALGASCGYKAASLLATLICLDCCLAAFEAVFGDKVAKFHVLKRLKSGGYEIKRRRRTLALFNEVLRLSQSVQEIKGLKPLMPVTMSIKG
jgi:hypothetical protein